LTHGGDRGAYLVDWFVTQNGKVVGPLSLEGVIEVARRGDLARDDCVWDPSADKWQLADHVSELWLADLETSHLERGRPPSWGRRAAWLRAAAAALIVAGSALVLSVTMLGSSEDQRPPSAKLSCSLEAYLQGKCR
jgi:GYF domain 2